MLKSTIYWLLTPLSGAAQHDISPWASWHGRCMVLAWSILLPLGVIGARFFKIMPGQNWPHVLDNKTWWWWHQILQYGGIALMLVGMALIFGHARAANAAALWHARLGWLIVILGIMQVASGILRGSKGGPTDTQWRGDHYDMTPRRIAFEWLHKCGGYAALLLAAGVTFSGLYVADAPRWMVLYIALWWLALGIFYAALQKQGRCIDTWQAIWGEGKRNYPLIGWGIRQYTAEQWKAQFHKIDKG